MEMVIAAITMATAMEMETIKTTTGAQNRYID